MNDTNLTIFTPTYNRAYVLPKLYESLCKQSCLDFVWLVVDDGSNDSTSELVKKWMDEKTITIQYHWQKNGGKHRAHNLGVRLCTTDWFVCVDSDEQLLPNAVELMHKRIDAIIGDSVLAGIISPKKVRDIALVRKVHDWEKVTMCELYQRSSSVEALIVLKKTLIEPIPFPEFEGERFVTEDVLYDELGRNYKFSWLKDSLVVTEYLADGYSVNEKKLYLDNPHGWAYRFNQRALNPMSVKSRFICCAKYVCFSMMSNQAWWKKANYKIISILAIPLAIYYKQIRYKK